jgi:hypothetical protein
VGELKTNEKIFAVHTQSIHHGGIFHHHPCTIHPYTIRVFPKKFHLFGPPLFDFLSPMEITAKQSKPYDIANPMVDLAYNTLIVAMCLLGELSNLRGFLFQKRWRGFWKPKVFFILFSKAF